MLSETGSSQEAMMGTRKRSLKKIKRNSMVETEKGFLA